MKTREQIIEDYFRARGWEKCPDGWWDGAVKRKVGLTPHIDTNFDLFREHVIEVMTERYLEPDMHGVVFYWVHEYSAADIYGEARVIDNQWLLAAIKAATLVLRGEQDAK